MVDSSVRRLVHEALEDEASCFRRRLAASVVAIDEGSDESDGKTESMS